MMAWRLCRKDLAIYVRDRLGLTLGLGLPVVLALVFGAAMGSLGGDGDDAIARVPFAVEDHDRSEASRALVAELMAAEGLRVREIEVVASAPGEPPAEDLITAVSDGDVPGGLLIPAGFGARLLAGEPHGLELHRDPGKAIEQQVIAGNLVRVLFVTLGDRLGSGVMLRVLDMLDFPGAGKERAREILDVSWSAMVQLVDALEAQGVFAALAESASEGSGEGDAPEDEAKADEGFDLQRHVADLFGLIVVDEVGEAEGGAAAMRAAQQAHAVSGIAVMMLLFGLVTCGGTLLQEQAEGTLDRLRLAPAGVQHVLAGKFLFTWLIGMTQLGILFLVVGPIFSLPVFRDPLALVVLSAAVAAAATGFGVLFAALCRTRPQLEGASTVVILTMSAVGGSWWPLVMTPEWYQKLAHFTLNAWAMDGYQGLFWYGKDLGGIAPEIGVLLGIAALSSLLALVLWRRRLRIA